MKSMCPTFQALTVAAWQASIAGKYAPNPISGCWVWLAGCDSDGYGATAVRMGERVRNTGAHRASWIAHRGPVPAGLTLDHLCWNRKCVNPDHLEPVTFEENVRRRTALRRDFRWRGGDRIGPEVPRPRLPLEDRPGCGKHGKSDGKWADRTSSGRTPFWRCAICRREYQRGRRALKAAS